MNKPKAIPCGFCDHRGPIVYRPNGINHMGFHLECPRCGREGDMRVSEEEAVISWNRQIVGVHVKDVGRFYAKARWFYNTETKMLALGALMSNGQLYVIAEIPEDDTKENGAELLDRMEFTAVKFIFENGFTNIPSGVKFVETDKGSPLGFYQNGGKVDA